MRRFFNTVKACRRFVADCVEYKLVILSVIVYLICMIACFAAFFWPPSQMAIKLSLLGVNGACAVLWATVLKPYCPKGLLGDVNNDNPNLSH